MGLLKNYPGMGTARQGIPCNTDMKETRQPWKRNCSPVYWLTPRNRLNVLYPTHKLLRMARLPAALADVETLPLPAQSGGLGLLTAAKAYGIPVTEGEEVSVTHHKERVRICGTCPCAAKTPLTLGLVKIPISDS
jgi:hypothetical protein